MEEKKVFFIGSNDLKLKISDYFEKISFDKKLLFLDFNNEFKNSYGLSTKLEAAEVFSNKNKIKLKKEQESNFEELNTKNNQIAIIELNDNEKLFEYINHIKNNFFIFIIKTYNNNFISNLASIDKKLFIFLDKEEKYFEFLIVNITNYLNLIDELSTTKKALEEKRKKYISLLENNPIGILLADIKGNILEVNECMIKMLGSPSKEATKKLNLLTLQKLVEVGFSDDLLNCIKFKTAITNEYPYKTVWGKDVVIKYIMNPLTDESNQVVGIYCLFEDITEKKKIEEAIIESLHEKETLLKEIHHRVKNNLQIISSLINLQANKIKDKRITDIFRESQNRIKAMSIVHEELYQNKKLISINLESYIKNLTYSLYKSYRLDNIDVKFDVSVNDINIDIENIIPIALILNETISNSLKYAFINKNKEDNKITINFYSQNLDFIIIIKDNGIGLPSNIEELKTKSLGLSLIESLTSQIGGSLEIDCNNGTCYKITFPINQE